MKRSALQKMRVVILRMVFRDVRKAGPKTFFGRVAVAQHTDVGQVVEQRPWPSLPKERDISSRLSRLFVSSMRGLNAT